MHLIVGLGNPGAKYSLTRHNIGFMVIDALAHYFSYGRFKREHRAETALVKVGRESVLLTKPQTFMNLSGESVRPLIDYYDIEFFQILVIHDEVDLPFGTMKYQKNRGHGGHNGVRSIHKHLGTNEYCRLRAGVGRPQNIRMDVADFVLQNFSTEEQGEVPDFLSRVGDSVIHFIEKGFAATANYYNQIPLKEQRKN